MKSVLAVCLSLFSFIAFAGSKVTLFVSLSPAGSFQATSTKAKGNVIKKGDTLISDKISVSIESFKTGIDLRDEHTWKHLNSSKHPKAILTNVKGQNGKASGVLEVAGVKKPVNIDYKVAGQDVNAKFSVKASDFGLAKAEYLGVGVNDSITIEAILPYKSK